MWLFQSNKPINLHCFRHNISYLVGNTYHYIYFPWACHHCRLKLPQCWACWPLTWFPHGLISELLRGNYSLPSSHTWRCAAPHPDRKHFRYVQGTDVWQLTPRTCWEANWMAFHLRGQWEAKGDAEDRRQRQGWVSGGEALAMDEDADRNFVTLCTYRQSLPIYSSKQDWNSWINYLFLLFFFSFLAASHSLNLCVEFTSKYTTHMQA